MKHIFLLAAILCLGISFANAQARTISQLDYSLTVPDGWQMLPAERINALQAMNPQNVRAYITGYTSDVNREDASYFTANFHEIPNMAAYSFDEVLDWQAGMIGQNDLEIEMIVDRTNQKFYYDLDLGRQYVLTGFIPGAYGIVYLNYYGKPDSKVADEAAFLQVLQSIQMRPPFSEARVSKEEKHRSADFGHNE